MHRALVVAPLRVARQRGRKNPEVGRFSISAFNRLSVQPISASLHCATTKRLCTQSIWRPLRWLVDRLGEQWPFDMVVVDEASKLRSFRLLQGSKRARPWPRLRTHKVRRWINLSGTIAPNGLSNLWAPMWFIDRGQRLDRSYDSFESRWFRLQAGQGCGERAQDPHLAHRLPHAFGEITSLMRDVTLALNPKDWFAIKDPIVVPVYVDLPPEARKSTVRWSATCSRTSTVTTSKPSRRRAR